MEKTGEINCSQVIRVFDVILEELLKRFQSKQQANHTGHYLHGHIHSIKSKDLSEKRSFLNLLYTPRT